MEDVEVDGHHPAALSRAPRLARISCDATRVLAGEAA